MAIVNDLIFNELLKRGCKLKEKIRVWDIADSKLWYLTPEQSQNFLNIEKSKDYKTTLTDREVSLIKNNLKQILSSLSFDSCNLVDLGCGDGRKASLFIEELSKNLKLRYCPIDISSYMVKKAVENIRGLNVDEIVEFKWNISDFENLENITPLLRTDYFKNNLMLLLGNTLGNFDRGDMLSGIAKSMVSGDVILIGNGLRSSSSEDLVKAYKSDLVNKFLMGVLYQIGIKDNEVNYVVKFVDSKVEMTYTFLKDKEISHLEKSIKFKKGDIILVAISYKHFKEELKQILLKYFKDVNVITDDQETYALALCKK